MVSCGCLSFICISIHALLAESDISPPFRWLSRCISIHALLAESDGNGQEMAAQCVEFLSTLSLRRATTGHGSQGGAGHRFLSTLSLRRATMPASWIFATPTNFYPRSPCGERPHRSALCGCLPLISIHALLAESDLPPCGIPDREGISIHALLAESDVLDFVRAQFSIISIHALLAESDGRTPKATRPKSPFLSTLSLRRATDGGRPGKVDFDISIHALLAESDPSLYDPARTELLISIHALLAESDNPPDAEAR